MSSSHCNPSPCDCEPVDPCFPCDDPIFPCDDSYSCSEDSDCECRPSQYAYLSAKHASEIGQDVDGQSHTSLGSRVCFDELDSNRSWRFVNGDLALQDAGMYQICINSSFQSYGDCSSTAAVVTSFMTINGSSSHNIHSSSLCSITPVVMNSCTSPISNSSCNFIVKLGQYTKLGFWASSAVGIGSVNKTCSITSMHQSYPPLPGSQTYKPWYTVSIVKIA